MLEVLEHRDLKWYFFEEAKKENFKNEFFKKMNFPPYVIDKFIQKSTRDKVIVNESFLFISLHFPDLKRQKYYTEEIKFIIGHDFIMTNIFVKNEGLEKFKKTFSFYSFENDEEKDNCVAFAFIRMIEKIYENVLMELKKVEKKIDEIEDQIFKNKEQAMVKKISLINRELLDFKKNIRSHPRTWNVFLNGAKEFFHKKRTHNALDSILIAYEKVITNGNELSELIHELRDTNNSLLSAKQNEISKSFTLITFLTLPATLFFTIVSLPTQEKHMFIGQENDFTLIMTVGSILFILMLIFTIWKKWW